jgi:hypothetical protein
MWERGETKQILERRREKKVQKEDRMNEKDMEKEGQNGKRKGWGIEEIRQFFLELLFFR